MHILSYIHPTRTYLPCTGVGRHINNMLLGLAARPDVDLTLFYSQQWLGPDGQLDPRSPLRGLPARTFPMPENRTERLWKLVGRPRMDGYIPNGTDWVYAPVSTLLPIRRSPVAVTFQDIQAFETNLPWSRSRQHRWFRAKWKIWVCRALKQSKLILAGSEFTRQRLVRLLRADPYKVEVVGNGVEPAYFEIAAVDPNRLNRPTDAPYILVIGGLRKMKGAAYTLAVARELFRSDSELQIVVAGNSEPEYAEAAHACGNIRLLGVVSDDELPSILRGSVALLFLSPYEGFGIPAAEAMAAGVPAVVANRTSLPEVVGDAGFIVDPDSTGEIVDILVNLTNDSALRQNYIARGLIQARQHTWSRCVQRLVDALERFS